MGADYYESENLEFTYTYHDKEYKENVEISINRGYIYPLLDGTYDTSLKNELLNIKCKEYYTIEEIPDKFINIIVGRIRSTHYLLDDNVEYKPMKFSDEELEIYCKIEEFINPRYIKIEERIESIKNTIDRINLNKLREINFRNSVKIINCRYFTTRWERD